MQFGELMLVRYILKNAGVLQTMKIWNSIRIPRGIRRTLSAFSRASSTCKLTIKKEVGPIVSVSFFPCTFFTLLHKHGQRLNRVVLFSKESMFIGQLTMC
jgi:hypothetical protein